jgi:enoyl reductase-like protein
VDDAEWEKTYQKATGGVITVLSEMGEPIHKLATRGVLFWQEMDLHTRGISNCLLSIVRGVCLLCNHHARAEETAVEGMMIAKEAHTSYNAKKAIADAPGVDDAEWEKTYHHLPER